jgi:hypothetical protein
MQLLKKFINRQLKMDLLFLAYKIDTFTNTIIYHLLKTIAILLIDY